mmetsp:Transcript_2033/g.5843  ORF Transcript_2033/g.5843 Transcript_2033/m.5843 type:complete len:396 (-) Transcript_2033:340-1527(-)
MQRQRGTLPERRRQLVAFAPPASGMQTWQAPESVYDRSAPASVRVHRMEEVATGHTAPAEVPSRISGGLGGQPQPARSVLDSAMVSLQPSHLKPPAPCRRFRLAHTVRHRTRHHWDRVPPIDQRGATEVRPPRKGRGDHRTGASKPPMRAVSKTPPVGPSTDAVPRPKPTPPRDISAPTPRQRHPRDPNAHKQPPHPSDLAAAQPEWSVPGVPSPQPGAGFARLRVLPPRQSCVGVPRHRALRAEIFDAPRSRPASRWHARHRCSRRRLALPLPRQGVPNAPVRPTPWRTVFGWLHPPMCLPPWPAAPHQRVPSAPGLRRGARHALQTDVPGRMMHSEGVVQEAASQDGGPRAEAHSNKRSQAQVGGTLDNTALRVGRTSHSRRLRPTIQLEDSR